MDLSPYYEKSKDYFLSNETLTYEFRIDKLCRLEEALRRNEHEVFEALKADLNKSPYEAFMTEVGIVYSELKETRKKLKSWMKPKKKMVSIAQMPGIGYEYKSPYGVVLIMSPWNYPFQLTILPLIGAIAAGNCAFVKPSAYSPKTSLIIKKILSEAFDEKYIKTVEGGRQENQNLLNLPFDYIFFTGGMNVGKHVMECASKHLIPFTLELGGKSPCIVDQTADLNKAAKRLLFGKLMNAGQTCIAPDYLLVEKDIHEDFVEILKNTYRKLFPSVEYFKANFPWIINQKHFDRLCGLIDGEKYWMGLEGKTYDKSRQIPLTIVDNATFDSKVMGEEIFGPILPVIEWENENELISCIRENPNPLALYIFSKDDRICKDLIKKVNFGGATINDTLLHVASSKLAFGGVGRSGIGRYHGIKTFETFSHTKSVLKKSLYFDAAFRHHPFKNPDGKLPEQFF